MTRFKPGDAVRVVSNERSVFAGVQGIVAEVKPHPRKLPELDSYTLRFNWGETQTFWAAQLEPADEKPAQRRNYSDVV
jgi:hypothetical protein